MKNWNVYYDCRFETFIEDEPIGKEIPVNQDFDWGGEEWKILSLYDFDRGLMLDLCRKVEEEETTREPYQAKQSFSSCGIYIDDLYLRQSYKAVLYVDPSASKPPAIADREQQILHHYQLDENAAWLLVRITIPCPKAERPDLFNRELKLLLQPQMAIVFGDSFTVKEGLDINVEHPLTKELYNLKIKELEWMNIDCEHPDDGYKYPDNQQVIIYTMEPDLDFKFRLVDCSDGDRPQLVNPEKNKFYPKASCDAAMIQITHDHEEPCHCALSASYFSTEHDIQWKTWFTVMVKDGLTVSFQIHDLELSEVKL